MVSIGNYKVGLFLENKESYNELGDGNYKVKNENEYARTGTSNVVLLLDEHDKIVDIDDIPTSDVFENVVGEEFVAFLQGKDVCAFVVNIDSNVIYLDDNEYVKINEQGILTYIKIVSDDFDLEVTIDIDNSINIKNINEGDMLLLYLDNAPQINKDNNKTNVYLFMGCVKILETNLD